MGWSMIIIGMIFFAHAKFGYLLPGALHASEFSWGRVMTYLYLSNQGIFGMILEIAATLMIAFLTFGAFLNVCGAGQAFMKLSLALLGHVRGGPAKVSIIGSAMFGTVTGSPIAEIGVIGTFTIPLMKRIGYSPTFAGAIEAAAACGGVIDPPVMGAVAFVMADITGIGYGQICIAAIIPAVLYYLSIFFQLDLRAASSGLVGLPREQLPSIKEALAESWMLFLPIAALVTWMMVFMHEPTVAVYIALAVLILSGLPTKKRLTFRQFIDGLEKASLGMIEITPLCAIAGIIIGSLTLTGLGIKFSGLLVALSGGSMLMLAILTSAAIYIMGMGISSVATYILMGVMVAPALTQMGVPLLVAHFFIFYMTVSMFITPPYAPAAYVAAAVARASPLRVGYQAMKLAVVAYLVPFIIIFQPALLWQGPLLGIAQAAGTAVIAVFSLSVAFEGYCFTKARPLERLLWLAGGLLLFYPDALTDIVGVVVVAGGFLVQLLKRKRSKAALVEADHEA
jgi:TRAP transporter 4TM/12TM fusion protein